jgi:hypothetical protein
MTRGRLRREKKTIAAMVAIYCADHHGGDPLCVECRGLLTYALARLDHCRFGERKPVCTQCTVHCYGPAMRKRVREVMRYAGPRMTLRHPVLAAAHLAQARKGPAPPTAAGHMGVGWPSSAAEDTGGRPPVAHEGERRRPSGTGER